MKNFAVLLCAGSGTRMGAGVNKVLLQFEGESVVRRSLKAIIESGCFTGVAIVYKAEDKELIAGQTQDICPDALLIEGGKERQDSVYNALISLPKDTEIVSIHDAARCFTTPELIRSCVRSAEQYGSGAAAKRCVDTVKKVDGANITATVNRDELVLIETPQAFKYELILQAYENARINGIKGTDDCSLLEAMGKTPRVVLHEGNNKKITYKSDLPKEESKMTKIRVGYGFDAHRLVEERPLILGGVKVPYEKGLLGHSDADVLTHAVMDALLGAAGLYDIGRMFPDNDMSYKDADSVGLLKEVISRLTGMGYSVVNVDATVVCQRPKLFSYIDDMRSTLAEAMQVEFDAVNVKATTTEKMGYEGSGEGISANAVCLIER